MLKHLKSGCRILWSQKVTRLAVAIAMAAGIPAMDILLVIYVSL